MQAEVDMVATHRVPDTICVNCGKALNGATLTVGDAAPSAGDLSMCLYCGHLMAYTDDLTLRNLTRQEMHEVAGDPHIRRMQKLRSAATDFSDDASLES